MEPAEFWHKLFHKYFTRQCVCVKAEPSEKEVEEVMAKEEKRIKEQVEKLGPEGLAQQAKRLADAIEENTVLFAVIILTFVSLIHFHIQKNKPPPEVLEQLIVRDLEQFYLIPVKTLVSADGSANEKDNGVFIHKLPFHTFLHQVKSDFFEVHSCVLALSYFHHIPNFTGKHFDRHRSVVGGGPILFDVVVRTDVPIAGTCRRQGTQLRGSCQAGHP
jgi:hypothetical protein